MKNYAIITISIMVLAFTLPNAYGQTVDNQTDRDNLTEAQRQEEVQKTGKEICESFNKRLELENLSDQMFEC
ncbi:MAG TPA: hypothetical protein VIP29_06115 [Nitrososphaeraceae archaeon]